MATGGGPGMQDYFKATFEDKLLVYVHALKSYNQVLKPLEHCTSHTIILPYIKSVGFLICKGNHSFIWRPLSLSSFYCKQSNAGL